MSVLKWVDVVSFFYECLLCRFSLLGIIFILSYLCGVELNSKAIIVGIYYTFLYDYMSSDLRLMIELIENYSNVSTYSLFNNIIVFSYDLPNIHVLIENPNE